MSTLAIKDSPRVLSHFITHWNDVNTALSPHPFVLRSGYTVDQLGDDRRIFEENQSAIATAEGPLILAAGQRTTLRQGLRERIRQFRGAVVGEFPEIAAGRVPTIPVMTASDSVWDSTLSDIIALWTELNGTPLPGFTPPLTLCIPSRRASRLPRPFVRLEMHMSKGFIRIWCATEKRSSTASRPTIPSLPRSPSFRFLHLQ